MSKVVKSVTRVVSKVVKGAANAIKGVAKSKFGKILLTAAAVYFGGAALAGGFSSSAAGGSFLSGMGTGVANAASGLSTAWSSALGGNFSGAGNALASGFQGQAAGGMTTSMAGAGGAATAPVIAPPVTPPPVPPAAGMSVGEGLMGAAKVQAGTALIGGVMQGKGQADALADQRAYDERMAAQGRERYGQNVGANLWSTNASEVDTGSGAPRPAAAPAFAYDPYAELQRLRAAREAAANPTGGIIARNTTGYTPYRT